MVAKFYAILDSLWCRLICAGPSVSLVAGNTCKAKKLTQIKTMASGHTRTISYWSEGGHYYRWRYTAATLQQTWKHVASLADDPTIELTWDDVGRIHRMMEFMEATQDRRDVVGL